MDSCLHTKNKSNSISHICFEQFQKVSIIIHLTFTLKAPPKKETTEIHTNKNQIISCIITHKWTQLSPK